MVEWLHALQEDTCLKMAEFPERCSLSVVAKRLFVLPQEPLKRQTTFSSTFSGVSSFRE